MSSIQKQRLIRSADLAEQLGVSRTTLWRMTKDGTFPAPVQLTAGIKGWLPSSVDAWLEAREAV
jgi:prophage regulatory protein